jgi:hypothetical protein
VQVRAKMCKFVASLVAVSDRKIQGRVSGR